jgi:hypothetical protein
MRTVLSDWDANAVPPRAEILRITQHANGAALVKRLPAALA